MTNDATAKWRSALELLRSSGDLGRGHVTLLRMTQVIEADDMLVLVVGSALPRDIIEQHRVALSMALASVWGTEIDFDVLIDPAGEPPAPASPGLTRSWSQATAPAIYRTTPTSPGAPVVPAAPVAGVPTPYQAPSASAPSVGSAAPTAPNPLAGPSAMAVTASSAAVFSDTSTAQASAPEPPGASARSALSAPSVPGPSTGSAASTAPGAPSAPTVQLPLTPVAQPDDAPPPPEPEPAFQAPTDQQGYQYGQFQVGAEGRSMASYVSTPQPMAPVAPAPGVSDSTRLNPRYTFDTYVQGASNRMARAAAFAVAEMPGGIDLNPLEALGREKQPAYNPLFIYGGSGLGKTHLLHAIGNYARVLYPGVRVTYVSSEEFVSDFIASVADGRMNSFKDRYRNVDILLLDDVQFLGGKEQTLEEFFHTFNALRESNKQIVLTSDQPPKELKGFEERLTSRFEWGLLADIKPPDLETRAAILTRKARADGIDIPMDVLEYIASRVTTNIRELEGALLRVTAFASLTKQPIDLTLGEMVLKDIISDASAEEITVSLIVAQVADYFDITIEDLCGDKRKKHLVHGRHIAMYLCRELTELSLPKIGQEFGGKDHTTVMAADRKIRTQMGERRSTFNEVTELTSRIKQAAQEAQH